MKFKLLIIALFLAVPAWAGCGTLVVNPTTGQLDCIGTGGGGGAVSSVFGRTGAVVAAAGDYSAITEALTNKTLGTGNIISIPVYVEFQGAVCQNATASIGFSLPVSNPAVAVCATGTNTQQGVAEFTATGQTVQGHFILPDDWVSGATNSLDIRFRSVGITGNTVWSLQTACPASTGASIDPSFNAAQTASVAAQGTTLLTNTVTLSNFTQTGCAAGRTLYFSFGLDGTTTTVGNQDLLSIRFKLKRTITTL